MAREFDGVDDKLVYSHFQRVVVPLTEDQVRDGWKRQFSTFAALARSRGAGSLVTEISRVCRACGHAFVIDAAEPVGGVPTRI